MLAPVFCSKKDLGTLVNLLPAMVSGFGAMNVGSYFAQLAPKKALAAKKKHLQPAKHMRTQEDNASERIWFS